MGRAARWTDSPSVSSKCCCCFLFRYYSLINRLSRLKLFEYLIFSSCCIILKISFCLYPHSPSHRPLTFFVQLWKRSGNGIMGGMVVRTCAFGFPESTICPFFSNESIRFVFFLDLKGTLHRPYLLSSMCTVFEVRNSVKCFVGGSCSLSQLFVCVDDFSKKKGLRCSSPFCGGAVLLLMSNQNVTNSSGSVGGAPAPKRHPTLEYVAQLQKLPPAVGMTKHILSQDSEFSCPYPGYTHAVADVPTTAGYVPPVDAVIACSNTTTPEGSPRSPPMKGITHTLSSIPSAEPVRLRMMDTLLREVNCRVSDCATANDYAVRLHEILAKQYDIYADLTTTPASLRKAARKKMGLGNSALEGVTVPELQRMVVVQQDKLMEAQKLLSKRIRPAHFQRVTECTHAFQGSLREMKMSVEYAFLDAREQLDGLTRECEKIVGRALVPTALSARQKKDQTPSSNEIRKQEPLHDAASVLRNLCQLVGGEIGTAFVDNKLLTAPTVVSPESDSVRDTELEWGALLEYDGSEAKTVAAVVHAVELVRAAAKALAKAQMDAMEMSGKVRQAEKAAKEANAGTKQRVSRTKSISSNNSGLQRTRSKRVVVEQPASFGGTASYF